MELGVQHAPTREPGGEQSEPNGSCSRSGSAERKIQRDRAYREKNCAAIGLRRKKLYREDGGLRKSRSLEYYRKNSGRIKLRKIFKLYGISPQEFDSMVERQKGKCAICRLPKKLVVDHCHYSKRVRGLLCGSCNRGVGLLRDSPEILKRALEYLTT